MLMPRLAALPVRPLPRARGLAALTVVMVLFLIMAMVAAYTNRNLVFEQRTAANTYRAERALVAADAAIDWTLSMLNGGRIDTQCRLDGDADSDFRSRYLGVDADGRYTVNEAATNPKVLYAGCINVDGVLSCGCPKASAPSISLSSTADPPGNAFRVSMYMPGALARTGAIGLDVRGCGTPGVNGGNCVANTGTMQVDGAAHVQVTLGVVRALPVAPSAALTAAASVSAGSSDLRITNTDAQTGYTVHAGNTVTAAGTSRYVIPAGSAGNGLIESDATLANLAPTEAQRATADDKMFIGTFGLDAPTYRRQQGVVRKTCDAACDINDLDYMLKLFPGRTFWFDGDLTIAGITSDASGSIGTSARPALVIVTGTLSVQAANPMVGLFYGSAVTWSSAGASVRGAVMSASNFTATDVATVTYDADVLKTLVNAYGTFVRAPGSWNRPTF